MIWRAGADAATSLVDGDDVRAALESQGAALNANGLRLGWVERDGDGRFVIGIAAAQQEFCFTCSDDGAIKSVNRIDDEPAESRSPDGRFVLRRRGGNLAVGKHGGEALLTADAATDYRYGAVPQSVGQAVALAKMGDRHPISGKWSPDGRRFLTYLLDERKVGTTHLVEQPRGDDVGGARLHAFKYPLPGDAHLPVVRYVVFDVESGARVFARHDPVPCLRMGGSPIDADLAWWSDDGKKAYFVEIERGEKTARVIEFDTADGSCRTCFEETCDTFLDLSKNPYAPAAIAPVRGGGELIWYSQRGGWGHLYLYDLGSGRLIRQLTSGSWTVLSVLHVCSVERRVIIECCGLDPDHDPYLRAICAVDLETGALRRLTDPGDDYLVDQKGNLGWHINAWSGGPRVNGISPDGRLLVTSRSRVDRPGSTEVRDSSDGGIVATVAEPRMEADFPWPRPQAFSFTAADGETPLYGLLFTPSHAAAGEKLPLIDIIYPGPQVIRTPKSGYCDPLSSLMLSQGQALAELGFFVMIVDGRGTPHRSKEFHDYAYGNIQDAGLPDHVAAVNELAGRFPDIDTGRVGIFGHSAGGYAAARAVLAYPDVFSVAVASSGNHDQRGFLASWGERYQGLIGEADYEAQSNLSLVDNLKGRLLLIHGGMDDGVLPSQTYRLTQALIDAGKDFDSLIFPHQGHQMNNNGYYWRRVMGYFLQHLRGEEIPADLDIAIESPFGPGGPSLAVADTVPSS